jgi:hypothetical protein
LKHFRGFLVLAFWYSKVFCYYLIKMGLTIHILVNALGSVVFGIVFSGPWDKFHGDLILEGCYTIMLSSIF